MRTGTLMMALLVLSACGNPVVRARPHVAAADTTVVEPPAASDDVGLEDTASDAERFNHGLVLERRKDYAAAAATYLPIITKPMPSDDEDRRTWLDAHFRRAACLSKSGDWGEVSRLFDIVLEMPGLVVADRIEALVGRGIADEERGAFAAAEIAFSHVVHLARDFDRDSEQELSPFVAEAAFHWGDIERSRYEDVKLVFPNEVLAKRLDEKCERLLTAQRRYLRAMHFGDAHTIAAAGNRIGGMYERLYDDLTGLEVPSDFDAEQRVAYQDEVKRRLRVLVEKAIRVYERTALAGKRTASATPWVEKSEAALARLRSILVDQTTL